MLVFLFQLGAKAFDFISKSLILCNFSLQEIRGQCGFFCHSLRRENICISAFVLSGGEVADLDQAFVDQRAYRVMNPADANADLPGEFSLRCFGVLIQELQDPEPLVIAP